MLAATALAFVMVVTSGCAWLDARQRQAIYRPTPVAPEVSLPVPAGTVTLEATVRQDDPVRLINGSDWPANEPQVVRMWWMPHANPDAPALLYLHGTFRNLYQNVRKIEALREAGFAILAVDYRGWGRSTPIVPSEATIKADAQLAWQQFVLRAPKPHRRVIYGHSMGGGVAVALAASLQYPRDHAALVLEATFASMPDVAERFGFWGRIGAWITTEQFDSRELIGRVQAPLVMLHGDADNTVPHGSGQALFAAANMPDKRFITIPGGTHSNLQSDAATLYQDTLRGLIRRLPPP